MDNIFRTYCDPIKHLVIGIAGCGEMAEYESYLLQQLGFKTRIVKFPGKGHDFVEVYLNGSWMVSDPGYRRLHLVTRRGRAEARIKEVGAASYVCAVEDGRNVELTDEYVPTDTVVIIVTRGGGAGGGR